MENEKAFNWQSPTAKSWGGSRSKSALVTIHAKPYRSGKNKTYSPYFRLHVNKIFLEKYYKGKTEGYISIAIGGKGILFDVKPSKNQPMFKFNKQRTISDKHLIENILAHFKTPISMSEVTTLKLHTKPFGEHENRPVYQFCLISDQNEETPHFYEPQKITIEG